VYPLEARARVSERDITVRGAVSIGRRLMDPLAELVKTDPKASAWVGTGATSAGRPETGAG
jgi:transcriptional accessory protein Tex/SPT6